MPPLSGWLEGCWALCPGACQPHSRYQPSYFSLSHSPGHPPPQLCRAEPRFGERVPYVVVYGEPGARLYDMVVPPRALVESGGRLRLHALYYITKNIIPALDRVLSLMGADIKVGGWVGGWLS